MLGNCFEAMIKTVFSMRLTPIMTINRRVGWTYPPALPIWEGGRSFDACGGFPRIILFEELGASPPWGRRERGVVLIVMIDRHVGLFLTHQYPPSNDSL